MDAVIKINSLSKSFGAVSAVKNVSYRVNKGEMFGLVGPDGSGKTTTIRILVGLLNPDNGSVEVLGRDLKSSKKIIKDEIGYLSQKFSLYGDMTVDENIEFFADIHGVKKFSDRRNELLEFTRLTPFRDRLADKLSGGMKQKLALACTLIHRPKIIFLDEPTTGVDPVSRRDFWKILSNLLKERITIFMSTPYLDEAERCNTIAMMDKGEIISFDTPARIKDSMDMQILEIVCYPVRAAYNLIKTNTGYEVQMFGDRLNVVVKDPAADYEEIKKIFAGHSITEIDKRNIAPSLENVFISRMSGGSEYFKKEVI